MNSSSPLAQYAGSIVVWNGSDWKVITSSRGTIVFNNADGKTYLTDGRRWITPEYTLPLKFEIEVFTQSGSEMIVDQIKDIIIQYVNNETAIEESVYLSEIYKRIQNLSDVIYARIIKPQTDILYKDIKNNLSKTEMMTYVPEYIYTDKDHITVIVRQA